MNRWFSEKDCGVGGITADVPMASFGDGGFVSRYVRIYVAGDDGLSKTLWAARQSLHTEGEPGEGTHNA